MKFRYSIMLMLMLVAAFSTNAATSKADATTEIQHLLTFISQSECIFIRNGSEHDANNARKHIEKKYNYLKSRLNSAEDFIEHAASKSSFSGKAYTVKCGNESITTKHWLSAALQQYRANH